MKTVSCWCPTNVVGSTELGNSECNAVSHLGHYACAVHTYSSSVYNACTLPIVQVNHKQLYIARPSTFPDARKNPKKGQRSIYNATFNLTRRVSFPLPFFAEQRFLITLPVQVLLASTFVTHSYYALRVFLSKPNVTRVSRIIGKQWRPITEIRLDEIPVCLSNFWWLSPMVVQRSNELSCETICVPNDRDLRSLWYWLGN